MNRSGHGPVRHQKFENKTHQDDNPIGRSRDKPYKRPSSSNPRKTQQISENENQSQSQLQSQPQSQLQSQPQSQPQPNTPSPQTAAKLLTDRDVFGLQDRIERINPYPLCSKWTQRPIEPIFGDPDDPISLGHFYALFHSLLNLPLIRIDDPKELQRASLSPFEKMELWQSGVRFDLVYVIKNRDQEERKFRIFLAAKKLTRPGPDFPSTTGERNYPILLDEDRMNFDVLCLFVLNKIAEAKRKT
jgi:hypothetical protein